MTYQVLARKWRPQVFDAVVGQDPVTRTLRNALASGRVAHAYLFTGPRGVGKTTTARLLAKALACTARTYDSGRTAANVSFSPNRASSAYVVRPTTGRDIISASHLVAIVNGYSGVT